MIQKMFLVALLAQSFGAVQVEAVETTEEGQKKLDKLGSRLVSSAQSIDIDALEEVLSECEKDRNKIPYSYVLEALNIIKKHRPADMPSQMKYFQWQKVLLKEKIFAREEIGDVLYHAMFEEGLDSVNGTSLMASITLALIERGSGAERSSDHFDLVLRVLSNINPFSRSALFPKIATICTPDQLKKIIANFKPNQESVNAAFGALSNNYAPVEDSISRMNILVNEGLKPDAWGIYNIFNRKEDMSNPFDIFAFAIDNFEAPTEDLIKKILNKCDEKCQNLLRIAHHFLWNNGKQPKVKRAEISIKDIERLFQASKNPNITSILRKVIQKSTKHILSNEIDAISQKVLNFIARKSRNPDVSSLLKLIIGDENNPDTGTRLAYPFNGLAKNPSHKILSNLAFRLINAHLSPNEQLRNVVRGDLEKGDREIERKAKTKGIDIEVNTLREIRARLYPNSLPKEPFNPEHNYREEWMSQDQEAKKNQAKAAAYQQEGQEEQMTTTKPVHQAISSSTHRDPEESKDDWAELGRKNNGKEDEENRAKAAAHQEKSMDAPGNPTQIPRIVSPQKPDGQMINVGGNPGTKTNQEESEHQERNKIRQMTNTNGLNDWD